MRVLITGAGLIGSYTAAALAARGHTAAILDVAPNADYVRSVVGDSPIALHRVDITDLPVVLDVLREAPYDCIIHTAGLIGGVAQRQPWRAVRINLLGTVQLAEAARLSGVDRFVFTSTQGVYDHERLKDATAPIAETDPVSSALVYGACKISAEHLLNAWRGAYDLDVTVVRFSNVYGRGTYVAGSVGGEHFNQLVEPPAHGAVGRLLPGAMGRSEWLYVKDAAHALVLAAEGAERRGYTLANIGSGALSTHDDIMAAVRAVIPDARFEEAVVTGPVSRAAHRSQPFDLTRAREALGYQPRYDLRAGVADYIAELRALA